MSREHIKEAARAARAARNEALRRHREELKQANRRTYPWMALFAITLIGWMGSEVHRHLNRPAPSVWRTDQAPALQPYYVVTQGYTTKKGEWKSFDNGESITVYHWTTAQP